VYEKDASRTARDRDWNMGFHWALPLFKRLIGEVSWDEVFEIAQVDPNCPPTAKDALTFVNASTGETINIVQAPFFHRLRRSVLREFLSREVDVKYGKALADVDFSNESSITAKFADGTSVSGSLIIGADGPRSTVRSLLLGPSAAPNPLPFVATYIQAKYTKEQALFLRSFHPLYLAGVHPDNKFCFFGVQDAPDPEKPEDWTFFFYISFQSSVAEQMEAKTWPNEKHLAKAKGYATTFCEPWKSASAWLPDNHPVWQINFSEWDPRTPEHTWETHDGRMTLAGDAAHVMTVQRGQGMNHSIADAAGLVDAVVKWHAGGLDAQSAIAEYEKEMKARAGEEVLQCAINSEMLHDWKRFEQSPVMQKGMNKG
jgi:2-polyprenyl-6-methoxyphenol hydroxylase-like FAD-dependent oxidoreductase